MFSADVLNIDAASVATRIQKKIREQVMGTLHRRGAVVGLSGGIDSSVVAFLCVGSLGADRVQGLFMPERDSSDDALRLGQLARRGRRHRRDRRGHRASARGAWLLRTAE